jgi:sulfite reductase beta subunit-like hemoprotein
MAPPDIPAAKRAGLPVDLERLTHEGDGWLTSEDRYALKTHGVCAQAQGGVFMVRIRVPGGVVVTDQARVIARAARHHAANWVHLTTRQNAELHWVDSTRVAVVLAALERGGLTTRSSCGHTLRNVMCSEDAGVGLDEPFDCLPDARAVSDAIVGRSGALNCVLPSRVNLAFGGSPRCRDDALVSDGAFVSVVDASTGEPGYEVWAGGSLGKSPRLAVQLASFVARADVLAAAEALIGVFIEHGDVEHPARGRMKFVVDRLGEDAVRDACPAAFARRRGHSAYSPVPVDVVTVTRRDAILAVVPEGGWSRGVRPQRTAGRASLTIDVPMGDLHAADVELLADLADRHADGAMTLSRDQNVVLRNVAVDDVAAVRARLADRDLALVDESPVATVRACTGSAVCALGITDAPSTGTALLLSPALARHSTMRVHVSGCPNSCAQHQLGDIGLAGTKVRVPGRGAAIDGFHVYLGADPDRREVGEVIGRVAGDDVPLAVDAVVGAWEAMRHGNEPIGRTVRRVGIDAFAAHLDAVMADRWATGPEPESPDTSDAAVNAAN